jgi:3-hydroxybutyryl-CoA dehydrogenase
MTGLLEIKKIGVLGAGQMGCGIAQVAAQAGFTVVVADQSHEMAKSGVIRTGAQLKKLVEKGKLDAAGVNETISRMAAVEGVEGFSDADLVIEFQYSGFNAATNNVLVACG